MRMWQSDGTRAPGALLPCHTRLERRRGPPPGRTSPPGPHQQAPDFLIVPLGGQRRARSAHRRGKPPQAVTPP